MAVIHDDKGNAITEFTSISGNRTMPVAIESGFDLGTYDYVSINYGSDGRTETYRFRNGGASGTLTATVVVVYRTTAKEEINTITKT